MPQRKVPERLPTAPIETIKMEDSLELTDVKLRWLLGQMEITLTITDRTKQQRKPAKQFTCMAVNTNNERHKLVFDIQGQDFVPAPEGSGKIIISPDNKTPLLYLARMEIDGEEINGTAIKGSPVRGQHWKVAPANRLPFAGY